MAQTRRTAQSIVNEMKIGWNLANTLDAPHGETTWHSPVTTKEMIDKVKSLGFNTVRIPISWHCHLGGKPIYQIDIPWLDRVQQIVDYVIDNDMFCIINTHHDDHLFIPDYEHFEDGKTYLISLWTQLCERFGDYGEKLLFESMNEPRELNTDCEWHLNENDEHCLELADCINKYNQVFVDTIRSSTNQNNRERFLLVPSYCAAPLHATPDYFKMPNDPQNRLILSVHAYTPYDLCLNTKSDEKMLTESGKKDIDRFMTGLYKKFVSQGTPVVIGETAVLDKNNPDTQNEWGRYFYSQAKRHDMICCYWDMGKGPMKILDRNKLQVLDASKSLLAGIFEGIGEKAGQ